MNHHTVTVTRTVHDAGTEDEIAEVDISFACTAPPTSKCRTYPSCDCEYWTLCVQCPDTAEIANGAATAPRSAGTDNNKNEGDTMSHEFGPVGEHVAAFIDALGRLTVHEVKDLASAWESSPDTARVAAWGAAWEAAWVAAREDAWDNARGDAGDATWPAIQGAADMTTTDAVVALVVLDLAARDRDLREACETLLAPARVVPELDSIIDQAWSHAENITKEDQ